MDISLWTIAQLWFCYFLVWSPAVPKVGVLATIDCIFCQAFGRNKYTDDELGQVLISLGFKAGVDDLNMLNALRYAGFDPGDSNKALALYILRIARKFNVPIIAQWEVVYAIFELDLKWYLDNRESIDCIWPPIDGYFATAHVKLASREKMRARGLSRPLEVAHPAMITRCVPIIWWTEVSCVVEPIAMGTIKKHQLWVWDENSVQPWTRNFESWKNRELLGRLGHIFVHVCGFVEITSNKIRKVAPRSYKNLVPGDWIRFFPPRTL